MTSRTEPLQDGPEIRTRWGWNDRCFGVAVDGFLGFDLPEQIQSAIGEQINRIELTSDTLVWKDAKQLIHELAARLPTPAALPMGGVRGKVVSIGRAGTESDGRVLVQYDVMYENGMRQTLSTPFTPDELSQSQRQRLEQFNRVANQMAWERFNEIYGAGRIDVTKWKQEKVEVFISYRGTERARVAADTVFRGLGEYEKRSVFLPRIDAVDMQAGAWMDQLMALIARCAVFVPVLTADYLEGPVARPELDLALREHFADTNKRIIPVLLEARPSDYTSHFLGGFHMVIAEGGVSSAKVDEIAQLALGLSRNPFEEQGPRPTRR